mgnify:CR=1 FL=1
MIKLDSKNYRKHTKANKDLIKKSLQDLGAGRSIVVDDENCVIAGNGVFEQAQKLKLPIKMVESSGEKLVVIIRTDLQTNDENR